jgi:hypothetical protein
MKNIILYSYLFGKDMLENMNYVEISMLKLSAYGPVAQVVRAVRS